MSQKRKKREEEKAKPADGGGFPMPQNLKPPSAHDLIADIDEQLEFGDDGGDECLCF